MENKFGENVKYIRSENDVTQKEFANIIGVSAATVSAYEQGEKIPNLNVAITIAEKFNVSLDWLCGMSDKESRVITDVKGIVTALFEASKIIPIEVFYKETCKLIIDAKVRECVPCVLLDNKSIKYFLVEWEKIYKLYKSGTINEHLYTLWFKEAVETFEEKSKDYKDEEYIEFMDDDVPF